MYQKHLGHFGKNTGDSVKDAVIVDASGLCINFREVVSENTTSRDPSTCFCSKTINHQKRKKLHLLEDTATVSEPEAGTDKLIVGGGVV